MGQMSFLGEIVGIIASVFQLIGNIYVWIIIGRVLVTWVNPDPYNPIVRFLSNVADPVLNRARRLIPLQFSGFDFSPIVVILVLQYLVFKITQLLTMLAYRI